MQTVKCPKCQDEILVLPDAKAMGKAVKNHVKEKHPGDKEAEDLLNATIFSQIP